MTKRTVDNLIIWLMVAVVLNGIGYFFVKRQMSSLYSNQQYLRGMMEGIMQSQGGDEPAQREFRIEIQPQPEPQAQQIHSGKASFYDYTLANGWSSKGHRVCASRDYPRKTLLEVTNVVNQKKVICLVSDFGPDKSVHPDRIIDLSSHAFLQLAPLSRGIIEVEVHEYISEN